MTSELRTWAGTYRFKARELVVAASVSDVQRAVAAGGPVRALGSRHSFNDLADTTGTLISVTSIDPDPVLDEAGRTVTVGAGMTYGALAAWLTRHGWALGNMASLPHISIGGTIATGTHGSGLGNQVLSAAVAALEYVGADSELHRVQRGDPGFEGMPVGLGAFGVVTRVTLDIEPSFSVRQDVYTGLSWDRALASLPQVMAAGYSVSLFTHWLGDTIQLAWIKRRLPGAGDDAPPAPEEFFGARLAGGPVRLADAPSDNITPIGVPGPWSERLPHFRADTVPSNGNEIQTEFFVPFDQGAAAIEAVRRLRKRLARLLLVSEIRAIAADDLWLSGAYGGPALALHFTWRREPSKVVALLPQLQDSLGALPVRPHWGKVWRRFSLDPLYPRLADARALFGRLDPEGRFSTERLELLGVREPRS
jgi:xylitol oxidase